MAALEFLESFEAFFQVTPNFGSSKYAQGARDLNLLYFDVRSDLYGGETTGNVHAQFCLSESVLDIPRNIFSRRNFAVVLLEYWIQQLARLQ